MKPTLLPLLVLISSALSARYDAPLRRRASSPAAAGAAPSFNRTRALAERDQAVKQSRYFPELITLTNRKRAAASVYMVDVDADTYVYQAGAMSSPLLLRRRRRGLRGGGPGAGRAYTC